MLHIIHRHAFWVPNQCHAWVFTFLLEMTQIAILERRRKTSLYAVWHFSYWVSQAGWIWKDQCNWRTLNNNLIKVYSILGVQGCNVIIKACMIMAWIWLVWKPKSIWCKFQKKELMARGQIAGGSQKAECSGHGWCIWHAGRCVLPNPCENSANNGCRSPRCSTAAPL